LLRWWKQNWWICMKVILPGTEYAQPNFRNGKTFG